MTAKKKNPKQAGRKKWDGRDEKEVLHKLKEAFLMDCTDEEACCYADIAMATFYAYQAEHPKYSEEKAKWKQTPFLYARQAILKGFQSDNGRLALDYMKSKKRDEFADRKELTGKDNEPLKVSFAHLLDPHDTILDGGLEEIQGQSEGIGEGKGG